MRTPPNIVKAAKIMITVEIYTNKLILKVALLFYLLTMFNISAKKKKKFYILYVIVTLDGRLIISYYLFLQNLIIIHLQLVSQLTD